MEFLTQEILEPLGYTVIERKTIWGIVYGKANDIHNRIHLAWNEEGICCDYYGVDLPKNIAIRITNDGGTRTSFDGYICSIDELKFILSRIT